MAGVSIMSIMVATIMGMVQNTTKATVQEFVPPAGRCAYQKLHPVVIWQHAWFCSVFSEVAEPKPDRDFGEGQLDSYHY